MTPKELIADRRLKIRLLRKAKRFLVEDWPDDGICIALQRSTDSLFDTYGVVLPEAEIAIHAEGALKTYVTAALGEYGWYHAWLKANGYKRDNRSVYKGRLAWIDWMIQCYQEDIINAKGKL